MTSEEFRQQWPDLPDAPELSVVHKSQLPSVVRWAVSHGIPWDHVAIKFFMSRKEGEAALFSNGDFNALYLASVDGRLVLDRWSNRGHSKGHMEQEVRDECKSNCRRAALFVPWSLVVPELKRGPMAEMEF